MTDKINNCKELHKRDPVFVLNQQEVEQFEKCPKRWECVQYVHRTFNRDTPWSGRTLYLKYATTRQERFTFRDQTRVTFEWSGSLCWIKCDEISLSQSSTFCSHPFFCSPKLGKKKQFQRYSNNKHSSSMKRPVSQLRQKFHYLSLSKRTHILKKSDLWECTQQHCDHQQNNLEPCCFFPTWTFPRKASEPFFPSLELYSSSNFKCSVLRAAFLNTKKFPNSQKWCPGFVSTMISLASHELECRNVPREPWLSCQGCAGVCRSTLRLQSAPGEQMCLSSTLSLRQESAGHLTPHIVSPHHLCDEQWRGGFSSMQWKGESLEGTEGWAQHVHNSTRPHRLSAPWDRGLKSNINNLLKYSGVTAWQKEQWGDFCVTKLRSHLSG